MLHCYIYVLYIYIVYMCVFVCIYVYVCLYIYIFIYDLYMYNDDSYDDVLAFSYEYCLTYNMASLNGH